MSDIVPIKPEIEPTIDVEREMLDFTAMKLRDYVQEYGAPASIALVLIGPNKAGSHTLAYSWSPKDSTSRFHTCSVAAMALSKRALGD